MKKFITTWLTELLGLELDRAKVAQLEQQASSARNQITSLRSELTNLALRVSQAEEQAAGHLERTTRVELQNLPVRYVQTSTGLQEVR
jgi:hypothetical protein